jgi:hypothetical protein
MKDMSKTRLSLFYLLTYLMVIGLGLLFAPRFSLGILQSGAEYGEVFPRVAGMLMVGLGIAVAGIIFTRSVALYPGTLAIRLFFCGCLLAFYFMYGDPLFIVLLIIVAVGLLLTLTSFVVDQKQQT